jgi:hypothetical protein
MSGTDAPATAASTRLERLRSVLNRETTLDALQALSHAVKPRPNHGPSFVRAAVGIDSNVFLRLASKKYNADIVDYFASKHLGPLVLPGQSIQEFWNNQLAAIETTAKTLKKNFTTLADEAGRIDPSLEAFKDEMKALLDKFADEYGYIYDENTMRGVQSLIEMLQSKALLEYAPRHGLNEIAQHRKRTRTPPGFKDDGDGDFFIWVEFLLGLMHAQDDGVQFDTVILVTNDAKADWSRDSVAHPILWAEVHALTGARFEIWSLEKLFQEIKRQSTTTIDSPPQTDTSSGAQSRADTAELPNTTEPYSSGGVDEPDLESEAIPGQAPVDEDRE